MNTKLDIKSKPILSPTRSLDEGFESDPDRISTDSESIATAATSTVNHSSLTSFDLYQRTDRDGVTHTSITRRNKNNSCNNNNNNSKSLDYDSSKSLICLPTTAQVSKQLSLPRVNNNNKNLGTSTQPRRPRTHIPNQSIPRSQSVDSIRTRDLELNRVTGVGDVGVSGGGGGDILSGEFVRVTVDPRHQQRMMAHSNNFYAVYPAYPTQPPQYGVTVRSYKSQQIPIGWTQSIPRQTRRYVLVIFHFIIFFYRITFLNTFRGKLSSLIALFGFCRLVLFTLKTQNS